MVEYGKNSSMKVVYNNLSSAALDGDFSESRSPLIRQVTYTMSHTMIHGKVDKNLSFGNEQRQLRKKDQALCYGNTNFYVTCD